MGSQCAHAHHDRHHPAVTLPKKQHHFVLLTVRFGGREGDLVVSWFDGHIHFKTDRFSIGDLKRDVGQVSSGVCLRGGVVVGGAKMFPGG